MVSPTQPGFQNPVHDAQRTFRTLLDALARPGRVDRLPIDLTPPASLSPACAGACLTLLDLDTWVWRQPGLDAEVSRWLSFHTGCRFTQSPQQATFALITDGATLPDLQTFAWGSAEAPEASTTLLIQVPSLLGGIPVTVHGPGILGDWAIAPQLPLCFWTQWVAHHQTYPRGVDVFLFGQHDVMGLPRTATICRS